MSITDELRKWVRDGKGSLLAIADRIDAEHERVEQDLIDANNQMEQLCECSVELPKDADGEYIHVGDVMELTRLSNKPSFEVRAMRYDEGGWEVFDRLGDRYEPFALRHYHAPTVEDVLREFADLVRKERVELATIGEDAIAEYASKLRLAEREDA